MKPEPGTNIRCPWCTYLLVHVNDDGDVVADRAIGIELQGVYDGVALWQCPHCLGAWHRFNETDPYRRRVQPYLDRLNYRRREPRD